MNTNTLNQMESSLDTTKKTVTKSIETALDSYKNQIHSLISNFELNEQEGYQTEMKLADYFHISTDYKEKLKEDYKPVLNIASVMEDFQDYLDLQTA